jgi:hypothetical protein
VDDGIITVVEARNSSGWNCVGLKGESAKRGAATRDVTNYELKARHREL